MPRHGQSAYDQKSDFSVNDTSGFSFSDSESSVYVEFKPKKKHHFPSESTESSFFDTSVSVIKPKKNYYKESSSKDCSKDCSKDSWDESSLSFVKPKKVKKVKTAEVHKTAVHQTQSLNNTTFVQGVGGKNTDYIFTNSNKSDIIYVNPINGPVTIHLDGTFTPNRTLTVKDSTLTFGPCSTNNIRITVPKNMKIEHYAGLSIVQNSGGTYVITGYAGCVTFRYQPPLLIGGSAVWVIENHLVGNPRITPAGMTFGNNVRNQFYK